jgi:hypothetical protein
MATDARDLGIGDWVKVLDWCGRIDDIATSEDGAVMLKIVSFKGIFNHHPHEWLEYIDGMIVPATKDQVEMSRGVFVKLALRQLSDIDKLFYDGEESGNA